MRKELSVNKRNQLYKVILPVMAVLGIVIVSASLVSHTAYAVNVFQGCDGPAKGSAVCTGGGQTIQGFAGNIINTLLFLLGIIAVIMIIIGGIRYTTSNGDASGTKGAKDTILYAVVGVIVAIMAYAIVNFVLGAF